MSQGDSDEPAAAHPGADGTEERAGNRAVLPVLLYTAARLLLAVVLTGMGSDGTHGAADIVAAGGSVIAQDEATSVVWGMPRSVAQAGLCSAVLPIDEIAPKILRLFSGARI